LSEIILITALAYPLSHVFGTTFIREYISIFAEAAQFCLEKLPDTIWSDPFERLLLGVEDKESGLIDPTTGIDTANFLRDGYLSFSLRQEWFSGLLEQGYLRVMFQLTDPLIYCTIRATLMVTIQLVHP